MPDVMTWNHDYNKGPDHHWQNHFIGAPVLTLHGIEGVKAALAAPEQWCNLPYPGKYRVKSDWIIGLITEIEASGKYPYNLTVAKLAHARLGLPPMTDHELDHGHLATLVYNAQRYRNSDSLVAEGYTPLRESMLQEAFKQKRKIVTRCGLTLTVREINGKLWAFKPRKRVQAVALGFDNPAKLA